MHMHKTQFKILISACLLGERVRYDAKVNKLNDQLIDQWLAQGILLSICPEVTGGLPTPRAAAEIQDDLSIKTATGEDVSQAFMLGAEKTLAMALANKVTVAVWIERFERRLEDLQFGYITPGPNGLIVSHPGHT